MRLCSVAVGDMDRVLTRLLLNTSRLTHKLTDLTPSVQIGADYLDPEMFLLNKEDIKIANLWLAEPRLSLYVQGHWPVEYVDIPDLKLTPLPAA